MGCRKITYYEQEALGENWKVFVSGIEKTATSSIFCKDYYAGGSIMPGRSFSSSDYRYGAFGFEKDDEVKGSGNHLSFGDYGYDPRLVRRWNVDPKAAQAPGWTPYRAFFNNPILFTDPDGNFEIPAPLAAKYPNLKPVLQSIVAELQKPENVDKLNTIVKYGEFKDANQLISLFSDDNKTIKLQEGNILFPNVQKTDLVGDQGQTLTSKTDKDANSGLLKSTITLDNDLFRLLGEEGLGDDAKGFVNKLFESTLIHEVVHTGDNQDGVKNSSEPLRFFINEDGTVGSNLHRNREIGKATEREIYGGDVSAGDNNEVKQNIIDNE